MKLRLSTIVNIFVFDSNKKWCGSTAGSLGYLVVNYHGLSEAAIRQII